MNAAVISSLCLLIFVPVLVNGLECYECAICNDPFNKNSATIVTVNGTGQSCYKTAAAGIATRGAQYNCTQSNILSVGTWCCSTDLCNTAPSTILHNVKLLIPSLLFIIALIKMI